MNNGDFNVENWNTTFQSVKISKFIHQMSTYRISLEKQIKLNWSQHSEAATETDFQNIYIFCCPGATFLQFSRRVYMFFEQTRIFQEGLSNRHVFLRGGGGGGGGVYLSNRPYYLIEQILIFQEALSSPRTRIIFQEAPMPWTDRHFPGKYHPPPPSSSRYFVNRSRWLFSNITFLLASKLEDDVMNTGFFYHFAHI